MTDSDSAHGVITRTMIVIAALVASASAALLLGVTTPAAGSSTSVNDSPQLSAEVPASIPPEGVNINDQVVLTPPGTPDDGIMNSAEAAKAASAYGDTGIEPSTLLAAVTVPGTIPPVGSDIPFRTIQDRLAWVVTFTSKEPVVVGHSAPGSKTTPSPVTHWSVVLDAKSGEFLVGFYTA